MKKTSILFSVSLILCLLAVSCAVNPVTGQRELMLISEAQEISLGKETDQQIRLQYGVYNDPTLNKYVNRIGQALAPLSHRPNLTYHFAVLDTPVVNAFAVPGGYIYVTRGILALMHSEAELAVVLGHELGHVNARHSVRSMSKMLLVQVGLAVGSALNETFADVAGLAGVGVQLLFLKYSRDDEYQADQLGVVYSRAGGYNPGKMINFFTSLQRMGDLSGNKHALPGFLSTHPLTKDRIEKARGMLEAPDNQRKIIQAGYLNRINNMVYGDDPRQGYVEGNTFYHPTMRFQFTFPPDWQVQNTPSQVLLAPKGGKAALILQAEKSSEDLKTYADKKAANMKGIQFINEHRLTINGMSSFRQNYNVPQQDAADLRAQMSFINYQSMIYTFTALSTTDEFNNYDNYFNSLVGSFKQLKDPHYINRKPMRIKLVKANGRQTLQSIFQSAGMQKDLWDKFALMNHLELTDRPGGNTMVKIAKL